MNALRLVTFDVTGTLLKLQPIPAIVYSQNAKDFGIDISGDAISAHFKTEWQKLSSNHPNFGRHSGLGWQNWWKIFVKSTLVQAAPNLSFHDERLEGLVNLLIEEYKTAKWWKLADGSTAILESLNEAKVPIGVISNYDPRLNMVLKAVGIRQYFHFVVTSYDVGVMKPDEKIFRAAQNMISDELLQPHNCLHVGDNIELDFKGAKNAGWAAAIVDPKCDPKTCDSSVQNYVFSSLHDLRRKLHQSTYSVF